MREIRFRVWSNELKRYCHNIETIWESGYVTVRTDSEFIIEQFTGLKDKNGKEIYEGDVVRYNEGSFKKPTYCNLVVKYCHHGFYAEGHDGFDYLQKNFLDEMFYEVIGNIHEERK